MLPNIGALRLDFIALLVLALAPTSLVQAENDSAQPAGGIANPVDKGPEPCTDDLKKKTCSEIELMCGEMHVYQFPTADVQSMNYSPRHVALQFVSSKGTRALVVRGLWKTAENCPAEFVVVAATEVYHVKVRVKPKSTP
jgi:hypothetical protein